MVAFAVLFSCAATDSLLFLSGVDASELLASDRPGAC
jgi:hypothetical protein